MCASCLIRVIECALSSKFSCFIVFARSTNRWSLTCLLEMAKSPKPVPKLIDWDRSVRCMHIRAERLSVSSFSWVAATRWLCGGVMVMIMIASWWWPGTTPVTRDGPGLLDDVCYVFRLSFLSSWRGLPPSQSVLEHVVSCIRSSMHAYLSIYLFFLVLSVAIRGPVAVNASSKHPRDWHAWLKKERKASFCRKWCICP